MQTQIILSLGMVLGFASIVAGSALPADLVARIEKLDVGKMLAERQQDPSYGGSAVTWGSDTCQGAGGHEAYLTFASCSTCDPVTDPNDPPNCDEKVYISSHDTASKFGNDFCNKYILINDDFNGCDSNVNSYSISTPNGWGNFISKGNCNNVASGSVTGTITTQGGYQMTCEYFGVDDHKWTSACGPSSSQCNAFLQCVGTQNPSVCP